MSHDLFPPQPVYTPLAELMRPRNINDVAGQQHLLGDGKPLRLAFESGQAHSMIFWGPPGVGKTTLARLTAHAFHCEFIAMSAVMAGVKDIRQAIDAAEQRRVQTARPSLLFIDEIHRFNKGQQDALLPHIESGLIVFVGATTENPSFEVNAALLSRAQVYVLQPLSTDELQQLFQRARTAHFPQLSYEQAAIASLTELADGDARRLLTLLEQTAHAALHANLTHVDNAWVSQSVARNPQRFDKGGDQFYDQISALHKSVRGSHPDAALYWLARMLTSGADPLYLARRIIRMAWEDIGLADPRALQIANDAAQTYERLGSPEGDLALGQAVIYLACAAKSNAGYNAFNRAMEFARNDHSRPVPLHLRNAPTRLMKELGYGQTYRYAHNEPHAYAAGASYMPDGMPEPEWYQPVPRGLEIQLAEKLARLKQWDEDATNGLGNQQNSQPT